MKFIYAPQDEELKDQGWELEVNLERPRLTAGEAIWLERHHDGKPLGEIFEMASGGSTTAMLSILFVMHKRSEPTLRYQDFEDSIVVDDLEVVIEDGELPDEADPKDSASPEDSEPSADGEESGTSPSSS